jgi:hypothetical protein
MRKLALGLLLSMAIAGMAAAQQGLPATPPSAPGPYGLRGQVGPGALPQLQAKSVEGKLAFANTKPTIVAKDKTYLLDMRQFFYYAYTDGIKAGDQMKLDGYELPTIAGQDQPVFLVTKAVINGKTYDFTADFARGMGRRGMGDGGMMGYGNRGYGHMRGQGGGMWGPGRP